MAGSRPSGRPRIPGRQVRSYRITAKGLKQLETEQGDYQRMADAIAAILAS